MVLWAALPGVFAPNAAAPVPPASATVDPNVAPWWELTVLPRIGETTARKIVRYRESVMQSSGSGEDDRAFQRAVDLERVRGIGPVTVRRIAPYLCF
ncbi:MAG: helix-hairpin-helix domain-containing protein [Phycisphaerae bacterium]